MPANIAITTIWISNFRYLESPALLFRIKSTINSITSEIKVKAARYLLNGYDLLANSTYKYELAKK